MGAKRNRKINYDTYIQVRISNELKEKATLKAKNQILSNYIRELIEKDCSDIDWS